MLACFDRWRILHQSMCIVSVS